MLKSKASGILVFTLLFSVFSILQLGINTAYANTQATYYVSPTGNDSNPGTEAQPFATIQKARDTVRTINSNMTGDIIVYLRGGTNTLSSTLHFNELDSGTNSFNIIYKNYPNENPIINGGVKVTGWSQISGSSLWKATVASPANFRQLYVNGKRAKRAASEAKYTGTVWYNDVNDSTSDKDGFYVDNNVTGLYDNADNVELHWTKEWSDYRLSVNRILPADNGEKIIVMEQPYFNWSLQIPMIAPSYDQHFYIENAFELLDKPGEWYFNGTTQTLYYYPNGEDMIAAEVYVPQVERLVGIQGGSLTNKAKNIRFEGLTFSHTTWLRASETGTFGTQAECLINGQFLPDGSNANQVVIMTPSAVRVEAADNIQFVRNKFEHMGAVGLGLINGVINTTVIGNVFRDISDAAIVIGDWKHDSIDPGEEVCKNIQVMDNVINKVGVEYWSAPAITAFYIDSVNISHNDISDIPYSGISMGWGWSAVRSSTTCKNNTISYNKIHEYMKRARDGGGIYTLGQQPNTVISYNYLYSMFNLSGALFPDEGSGHMSIHHNVVKDTVSEWLHIWTYSIHEITVDTNYTNVSTILNNGTNCPVTNTTLVTGGNWPVEAQNIMNGAGLEAAYQDLAAYIPTNQAPSVNAGSDQNVAEYSAINLHGYVNDDELTYPRVITYTWTKVSGPGTVAFTNPYAADTSTSFSVEGTYVLRLTANDEALSNSDDITVTVTNQNQPAYYENVALNKTATASSIFDANYPASKAVDGDIGTGTGACWSTAAYDAASWLEVDLGSQYKIERIEMVSRQLYSSDPDRRDFEVQASNVSDFSTYTVLGKQGDEIFPDRDTWTLNISDSHTYRYVRVKKTADPYMCMTIAELRVFKRTNLPPAVNAGLDRYVSEYNVLKLHGTVTDDGIPTPPALTCTWTKVSGPGAVAFSNPYAADTTASFSIEGTYVLRLTANDGALSNRDDTSVIVVHKNLPVYYENVALNKTATASSIFDANYPASKAIDGDIGTGTGACWSTLAYDAVSWLKVDLGSQYKIERIEMVSRQLYSSDPDRRNFEVQVSNVSDFSTYTVLGKQGDEIFPDNDTWALNVNDANTYRYVRVKKTTDLYMCMTIGELRVFKSNNLAPYVNAGTNQNVAEYSAVSLDGTVTDDGNPTPITLTTTWSKVSGPGTVAFSDPYATDTAASLSIEGTYVLRLTANDGVLSNSADVTITVTDQSQPADYVNVALNKTATALTSCPGYYPDQAVDGSIGSADGACWASSGGDLPWWQVDLADKYKIERIELVSRQQYPDDITRQNFEVQVSNTSNFSTYTVLGKQGSEIFAHTDTWTLNISNTTAYRYVRVRKTKDNYMTIAEFRVYSINKAPIVNAGPDQKNIPEYCEIKLHGIVSDDGKPTPPALTYTWTKVSGPGTVAFTDPNAADTTASVSVEGTYMLRLTASDTELSNSDDVIVTITHQSQLEEYMNVALNKTATASSIWDANTPASKGVDGDTGSVDGACWSSSGADQLPWWQVDLGSQYKIERIELVARQQYPNDVTRQNFEVQTSNTSDFTTYTVLGKQGNEIFANADTWTLNLNDNNTNTYRYIRVKKTVDNYMTIAEFRVFTGNNLAPSVNAGNDQTIAEYSSVSLNGIVSDDSLPASPGALTYIWTKVSGPGTVAFINPNAVETMASFSVEGTYILRMTASDSLRSSSDEVTITVTDQSQPTDYLNVALNKTATALTIYNSNYSASVAVDGNPGGVYGECWSSSEDGWCLYDELPWWQVDLVNQYTIKRIELVSRQAYPNDITRQNFEVEASNTSDFSTYTVLGKQGIEIFMDKDTWTLNINDAKTYRYLRIKKTVDNYMNIAELRVFSN